MIFRESYEIKGHYIKLQDIRKKQFTQLFNSMITEKTLRTEAFTDEYVRLYERMMIIGDNWINTSELFSPEIKDPVQYYQDLLFEMIYPYLTEKGKTEYKAMFH